VSAIGLIAGSGSFPFLFARAAREQGLTVHAVAHKGEADPALEHEVATLTWVKLGQARGILTALKKAGVERAVMAGGIGRAKSLKEAWPDRGALAIALGMKSFRDDELLRAVAAYFEKGGVRIVAPTDYVKQVLAKEGLLAGPKLKATEQRDVELGREVATSLGQADVGQTVVVKDGVVLAVEAVEGTDEAIRRGGRLGGPGAVVVKRVKPGQDLRFDLPAAGPVTLEVMREVKARVLAVEAGRTVLLDAAELFRVAEKLGISVTGF
jgi:UDP-2,3-diacylglucosamine hydrolase